MLKVQRAGKTVQNLSGGRLFAARFRQLENPKKGLAFDAYSVHPILKGEGKL